MQTTELTLSGGTVVKCRRVPPYALNAVYRAHPEPPFPQIEEHSVAGGTEKRPALPDTPEFKEYQRAVREHRRNVAQTSMEFHLNYGVVAWKFPNSDIFETNPPDDWQPDPVWLSYGGHLPKDEQERRVLYIGLEVLVLEGDMIMVNNFVDGGDVNNKSVTKEEVEAATIPFESVTGSNAR